MNRLTLLALPFFILLSCKSSETNKVGPGTLITIDNTPVPTEEFLYIYSKNNFNSDSAFSREDLNNYLDLYINFKLKVKEAEALGLHETKEFNDELEGYRQQLAKPYLTESGVTEKLVREAYERLKTEINASHILIGVSPEADPEDTLIAYKKAIGVREKALAGEPFAELAKQFSEDPSARVNGGNLGYFTALQMVYPFEDAAYNTKVGGISMPVRTRFGYHLIKVHDKRPSQGKIKVSHIMVRATEGMPYEDSIAARKKANEIYYNLKNGGKWAEIARQFSDDISSRASGGTLPWFGTGNMIPVFEEAAFGLDSVGEISEPVKTPYGWHIIKLDQKQGIEPFELMEPSLKVKVSKDSRSGLNKAALIKRLKKENEFIAHEDVLKIAIDGADSLLLTGEWKPTDSINLHSPLFNIKDKAYTLEGFYEFVISHQKARNDVSPEHYMRLLYKEYVEKSILDYEEAHLAEKYEDYRMLYQEYRDGILLFELMDDKVWSKAIEDSVGLENFFKENKDRYQWSERLKAKIYSAANQQVLEQLQSMLKNEYFPTRDTGLTLNPSGDTEGLNEPQKAKLDSLISIVKGKDDLLFRINGTKGEHRQITRITSYLVKEGIRPDQIITGENGSASIEIVSQSSSSLEKWFNKDAALALKIEEGYFEKGDNTIIDKINWQPGTYTIEQDNRAHYIIVEEMLPPGPKKLSDIKGQVISDYQNYLERQWVDKLKMKYPVSINQKELDKVYRKFETEQ